MERDPRQQDDPFADEEAELAGAEAAAIGGVAGDEDDFDPAERPVREAGGGEQEGFEQSEDLLIENAENAEHTTALDGFPEEREDEPDRASYGDADEESKEDA